MPEAIYYRIAGNAAAFLIHSINSIVMLSAIQDERLLKDPEIRSLASMQSRFLTIWNVAFQLAYAGMALTCDVLTVMNKDHLLPKTFKKYRDTFFSSVVFPGTLLIFSVFWPLFIYDRSLIFPAFIDKVFSLKSNYCMHFAIFPFVLWELAFQPRNKPKSHRNNISIMTAYYTVYNVHTFVAYYELGLWPYPFLHTIYGTIYYFYVHIALLTIFIAAYYVQWPLANWFWKPTQEITAKNK